MPDPVDLTLFADFTCPFSYVTELALETLAPRRSLRVRARALELFPADAPLPSPSQEPEVLRAAAALAAEVGASLRDPGFRPRTRKAHEAAAFAQAGGAGAAMRRAIHTAYWGAGRDIGRIDVLMELAEGVGLDPVELKIALDIDRELDGVLADEALAARLGVTQTPTLFVGTGPGATILQGARPLEALDEALAAG